MCHPNVLDVCSSRESFNSFGGISRSRWDCRLVCAILMYWTCVLLVNPLILLVEYPGQGLGL